MNLAFMKNWGKDMPPHMAGNPTYFTEKIWAGFIYNLENIGISDYEEYNNLCLDKLGHDLSFGWEGLYINPKLHTMRTDEKDRWKAGIDIHFYINNRTKYMFQFAPVITCVSTQKVEIKYMDLTMPKGEKRPSLRIDNRIVYGVDGYDDGTMTQIAINDGFDSVDDFFAYFNTDCVKKLIHWTNLKY